uniref:N-acetylmuramoyl-L-alanine amidase family protein n=2 Tax=Roseivirga sp. TaxID=1964215 RepID=UPI0040489873
MKDIFLTRLNGFFALWKKFRFLRKGILITIFMRTKVKNIGLAALLLFALISLASFQTPAKAQKRKYKVVIDPGHGGKDSGTRGKSLLEKEVVLAVSLKVGKYLEELTDNIEVIYTRKTDEYSHPKVRAILANDADADLFVSIHANAMPPGNEHVYGTETYVMGVKNEGRNFEVAKRENSVILLEEDYKEKYQGFDPTSPEVNIAFSIMQEAFQENSILLAQNVENQFAKRAGRNSRGVKQSSLWVLWNTAMPSVLIELGYLTNPKEEKELGTAEVQDYMASAIFRGIRDYINYLESTK